MTLSGQAPLLPQSLWLLSIPPHHTCSHPSPPTPHCQGNRHLPGRSKRVKLLREQQGFSSPRTPSQCIQGQCLDFNPQAYWAHSGHMSQGPKKQLDHHSPPMHRLARESKCLEKVSFCSCHMPQISHGLLPQEVALPHSAHYCWQSARCHLTSLMS